MRDSSEGFPQSSTRPATKDATPRGRPPRPAMENQAETGSGDKARTASESSEVSSDGTCDYPAVIALPEIPVATNEEDEQVMLVLRARLYRFNARSDETPEWIERGTGELKLLRHTKDNTVRVVMRRDKTFKVCANHFIAPFMELKPCVGTDKAFFYVVLGDYAFEELKSECFALKFRNIESANQFKETFNEAKKIVKEQCELYRDEPKRLGSEDKSTTGRSEENVNELTKKIEELEVEGK